MMILRGTWQDIPYESIPKNNRYQRILWKVQQMIDREYGDPMKAPKHAGSGAFETASRIVDAEDRENELPLDKQTD
jgi:hypothetical protein